MIRLDALKKQIFSATANARRAVLSLLLVAMSWADAHAADPVLRVVVGVTDSGDATQQWLSMLRRRLADAPYDSVARLRRPLSSSDSAWVALIRSRVPEWERELPALARTFAPIVPPGRVAIVLGNRGANDAFTHDQVTIGFDLAALFAEYGDPDTDENSERIDRLFRHEYVHLLQKAWLAEHPYDAGSPLRVALADIWAEGLGNYYSMSTRWRATNGTPSGAATRALETLEPRFAARLAALACAAPAQASGLMRDLSWGRFDQKWGALTPALWLEAEASVSDEALRRFVLAGPDGVWALAARHLPEALRSVVREAGAAAALCDAH